ncbi:hypothetical protein ABZ816_37705 [Actinosynnema sp. NPDC047251]|uniref:Uncharacterized protein n=1 Tax=Saccharothrix espanaensis (strain ATCC 51144 / DSM 44229 / JCM 9112 / NBRC 15066 / NRRL 15764) TaxID=1179773 RepID=K0K2L7_SACES|nr:hypothetical protein [Saccharothrix espanaensis]CCH34490.1 hypothetical protein BN6_72570 [Saccharothrix espanaensis DSM 44229]
MGAKEPEIVPLHAGFDVVYRGFHRRQVIEHIENLEEQLRYTSVDRAEALAQAADLRKLLEMTRGDLEGARARVERLEMSPATTAGATERLHRMLLLAEEESAELRLRAERDVDSLRKRTEVELSELRREAEAEIAALRADADQHARELSAAAARRAAELDQREVDLERRRADTETHLANRTSQVEADCAAAMAQAQDDADRLLRETAEQCNRLETESEERRTKAHNYFELTMTHRRDEAAQHFAEQEELAKARAAFVVKLACREAQRRIAEIHQNADELRELRRAVVGQFAAARAALAAAAERVPNLIPEQQTATEPVADGQRVGA